VVATGQTDDVGSDNHGMEQRRMVLIVRPPGAAPERVPSIARSRDRARWGSSRFAGERGPAAFDPRERRRAQPLEDVDHARGRVTEHLDEATGFLVVEP
jgi:hypothetical protein